MEQQVIGNVVVVLAVNQSTPAHVVNYLAVSLDFVQSALRLSGETLLLLGLLVVLIRVGG